MKKVYLLKGLDCPNCSAIIEREAGELREVDSSSLNLVKQTLVLEVKEEGLADITSKIEKIVHTHEPDVEVIEEGSETVEKVYFLKGLDCPNCSAIIEREVGELSEVQSSSLNLVKQRLNVKVKGSFSSRLTAEVERIVKNYEPDVLVIEENTDIVEKVYLLKGLDCPNCSAIIEREVGELSEVQSSSLNLIKQLLVVKVSDKFSKELTAEVVRIVKNYEPEVEVIEQASAAPKKAKEESIVDKKRATKLGVGAAVYLLGVVAMFWLKLPMTISLGVLVVAYVILGGDVVLKALRNICHGRVFDENFLMMISTVGAFVIGEHEEAVAVMLFYQLGEFFQDLAVRRSRKSIGALMDIRPDSANVKRNGKISVVAPESVALGELIVVKPGERIPLDGVVVEGEAMLDTRALTGESVPRKIVQGEKALSGAINQSGVLTIEVQKTFGESTVSKIIDLVENAASRKAPTENFITTFSRYYTPVVVILATLLAVIPPLFMGGLWSDWLIRGFVFLVVSCPCALVISIPLTFFGGIGAASKRGVLIKGSNYLEALNKVDTVVFDKTGTLTKGVFKVTSIVTEKGFTEEAVLEHAAKAEHFSNHPIAKSIVEAYGHHHISEEGLTDHEEISGHGIALKIGGKQVYVGNEKLMKKQNIAYIPCEKIGTKVYVAIDGKFAGCITISDEIKEDSKQAIADLKKIGIKKTVMLTGDMQPIAENVANEIGIDEFYAELLPEGKVEVLEKIEGQEGQDGKLAFVGDGINDAPVLARADVGISMGALGSDAAIEAADVVLMTDEPAKLADAIRISKKTKQIVIQNIAIALIIKVMFMILGAFGLASMWEAVFGDVGVTMIAVANAMRILKA